LAFAPEAAMANATLDNSRYIALNPMARLFSALVVLLSLVGCALIGRSSYSMSVLPLDAAFAINGAGAIAGRVGGNAAVYTQGTVVLLPGKEGYSALTATDIADNGFIVGHGLSAGHQRGLFWESTTAAPIDMGALGNVVSPRAVNSQGTVVGFYEAGPVGPRAFRWSRTTGMTDIAPDTTSISQAFDISETGYIAGMAFYQSIGQQVVRWNLDGSASRITGPGLAERALSSGSVFGTGTGGATLWTLTGAAIPIVPNPATHVVKQMSAAGRSVGFTLGGTPPRAWTTKGSNTPLYLPLPAGAIGFANDVNACGTILGSVKLSTNVDQFVIWDRLTCDVLPPVVTQ
jgi:probable HAF family extracellular repeat protein